jgi:hypothetical protein
MAWFTEFRVDDETEPHMICFFLTLNYRLPDKSMLWIEQEAVWCGGCRSFGSAEVIPSIEELNARIQELQTPTQKLLFIYRTQEAITGAIDELRTRLRWRATRNSVGRCLACGSTAITPVRFGEDRTCVVNGKRLTESGQGFADTADWIEEYTPEGIATDGPASQRTRRST